MVAITEDYVSFEVAKLLKEKGFNVYGDGSFGSEIKIWMEYSPFGKIRDVSSSRPSIKGYPAPTLQMAMKWLRLNYQIFIRPNTSFLYPIKWYSEIFCYGDNLKTQQDVKTEYYDSPEEACEDGIKYCLEHLI